MTKVAYIVGVGHSGTTLLDLVTGSIPNVFSSGELAYLPRIVHADDQKCSCLANSRECLFWKQVLDEMSSLLGFRILDDPLKLKTSMYCPNTWHTPVKDAWLALQRRIYCSSGRNSLLKGLQKLYEIRNSVSIKTNWQMFDTIAKISGCEYIVDSTKELSRLMLLHSQRPADIKAILLIRDIRGVAYSWMKVGRDPVRQAAKCVSAYNKILRSMQKAGDLDYTIVQYEKLCNDPLGESNRLADFLSMPQIDSLDIDCRQRHVIAGNPMRLKGKVEIRKDQSWKDNLDKDIQDEIINISKQLDPQLAEFINP